MFSEDPTLALLRRLMNPTLVVVMLVVCTFVHDEALDGHYLILAIISFLVSSYLFDDLTVIRHSGGQLWRGIGGVLFAWALTVCAVVFLGYLSKLHDHYSMPVLRCWFAATPVALFLAHVALRGYIRHLHRLGRGRRAVIVGGNEAGERLGRRLSGNDYLLAEFLGYFDDRRVDRMSEPVRKQHLGHTHELFDYIHRKHVEVVYIALPISQKVRISSLLNTLKDSTVSVYLVPDIFTYDLIQARIDQIDGVPVIAILETPFTNVSAFYKGVEDVLVSLAILVVTSPLMLLIALAVKLTSHGPVIFKQRRYGLNGEEIIIYKFRSMRVCEDGDQIRQATQNDDRVTGIGRLLRRTSMDELPQFINVLQGRMSIVGPRPHAVAHNKLYRGQISGYMLRHKVKPGITGWAQINGFRGETDTVEKMAGRVQCDLDYMRNWSLSLDSLIILKTVWLVFKDMRAY